MSYPLSVIEEKIVAVLKLEKFLFARREYLLTIQIE